MKKIIVVGGLGYIGTVVIEDLLKANYKIACIDKCLYGQRLNKKKFSNYKNLSIFKKDFDDESLIKKLFKNGYNNIIFLAALVGDPISKKYPNLTNEIMDKKTKKFIKFCKILNVEKFLFVSTCSNYGLDNSNKLLNERSKLKPLSLYAKKKVIIEKFLINQNINYTILRFSTAFGLSKRMRYDLTINEFVKTVFFDKKLEVYDMNTFRPYLHVKDFSRVFSILLETKKKINGKIYNVGSNENNFSKKQIIEKIATAKKINNISFLKKGKDTRNYKVNFNKLYKDFKFKPKYTINFGINEILNSLNKERKKFYNYNKMGNYLIKNAN